MTIRATDGDAPSNANMIYKIMNEVEVNSGFEIDPRNGLVKIKVRPDREVQSKYQLIVEANDQGKDPRSHAVPQPPCTSQLRMRMTTILSSVRKDMWSKFLRT
ncbi:hypothetical protein SRHO_G00119360 [Serrasalmus rhombeus]